MNTTTEAESPDEPDRSGRRRFLGATGAAVLAVGMAGCSGESTGEDITVELSAEPVPGRTVTATIRRDDDPVEGVEISVNGTTVGKTNDEGQVDVAVPYADSVVVTGRKETLFGEKKDTKEYDLPTDIDLEVTDGRAVPGETMTLRASIEGVPVADGSVEVNGEDAGKTDADGRVEVAVPDAESLEVEVSRGEASGSRTFGDLSARTIDLALPDGPPVPGEEATVKAMIDGSPVTDALVRVEANDTDAGDEADEENEGDEDGENNGDDGGDPFSGRTNDEGRVAVSIPYTESVTIYARRGEARGEREFDGLLSGIDVSLVGGPPIPGTTTTVEATMNGTPVADATVRIADPSADGETGGDEDGGRSSENSGREEGDGPGKGEGRGKGNGRGTDAPGKGDEDDEEGEGDEGEDEGSSEVVGKTDERGRIDVPVGYVSTLAVTVVRDGTSTSAEFDVLTDISITAGDPLKEGRRVTFTAAIEDVAVSNATVTVNGVTVGTTDESGAFTYEVPKGTDQLVVSVARGATDGSQTFEVNTRETGDGRDRGVGRDK